MHSETEDQTRLRRAREALIAYQWSETEARKILAAAVDSTKRAREKYEELFIAAENREVKRRLATYDHCTK